MNSKFTTIDFFHQASQEFGEDAFLQQLHTYFAQKRSPITIFAAGTAPMNKDRSEIKEILFASHFTKAFFVDPMYSIQDIIDWEIASLALFARVQERKENTIFFSFDNKIRSITFLPYDATNPQTMPMDFMVFFSGKRVGLYPGFPLRGTPSDYISLIIEKLPVGGYVIPDRELIDDSVYFPLPPKELGLQEVFRIKVSKKSLPEDTLFAKAKGLGLYKKR